MVAFANTAGGTIIIGVEDGTKHVRGVQDVLAAEEKLANMISDSIRPRLIPEIEVIPWRNLKRPGRAGVPEQLTPALPGTAGTRRRSLYSCRFHESKG